MKKKVKSKENISAKIDNLANVVKIGFEEVNKKFENVDKQFKNVDKQFEQMAIAVKVGFDEMGKQIREVDEKVDLFREEVDVSLDRVENILVTGHENRIERLEDKVRVLETTRSKR